MHFSTFTMQTLLFMASCILANDLGSSEPWSQGENLPSPEFFVPNDILAEIPALERPSIEDPDWSRLAGNGDTNCNSGSQNPADLNSPHSRFRRSSWRFFKRQNNDLCSFPKPENVKKDAQQESRVRHPGRVAKPVPSSGEQMRNMNANDQLMLIITQPHSDGKPNPEKCDHSLFYQVPICAPIVTSEFRPSSPQDVVVPSRFWLETDPCTEDLEDLWCCASALQLNLASLRYPAAGFQCSYVRAP